MEKFHTRKSTSMRQLEILVSFMESHRDLALGRVRTREARARGNQLWAECAQMINSEGVHRNTKDWTRFWNDYKCRVRAKLAEINRSLASTGGGPCIVPVLSPLEDRVAALIGRDVGPLSDVRSDAVVKLEIDADVELNNLTSTRDSPTLDLSLIPIINATGSTTIDSPGGHIEVNVPMVQDSEIRMEKENITQTPNRRGNNAPQPVTVQSSRCERRPMRPRVNRTSVHRTSVDEARASIARIEEMRARTEETMAQIGLRQAEAAVQQAQALSSIAQSLQIMAQGVQGYISHVQKDT